MMSVNSPPTPRIHNGRSKRRIHQTVSTTTTLENHPCQQPQQQPPLHAIEEYAYYDESSMADTMSNSSSGSNNSTGGGSNTHTHYYQQQQQQQRALEQNDWLDCQSLQRSLKRLKVTPARSASPGELCLQRDVKHAVTTQGWVRVTATATGGSGGGGGGGNVWKIPYHTTTSATNSNSSNNNSVLWLTLQQSPEDPLQLILDLPAPEHHAHTHQHQQDVSSAISLWIQVPRLYPHHPLEIRRILYHPQAHAAHNTSNNRPTDLHIQSSPDDPFVRDFYENNANDNNKNEQGGMRIVTNWTPLHRLDEILQLLVHVWYPHWTKATQAATTLQQQQHAKQQQQHSPSSHHHHCHEVVVTTSYHHHHHRAAAAEADCATEVPVGAGRDHHAQYNNSNNNNRHTEEDDLHYVRMGDAEHETIFPPNRFDRGYERGGAGGSAVAVVTGDGGLAMMEDCMQE